MIVIGGMAVMWFAIEIYTRVFSVLYRPQEGNPERRVSMVEADSMSYLGSE